MMLRSLRPLLALVLVGAVLGCSGGDDDEGATADTESSTTTTVVDFQGDGDSRYCDLSRRVLLAPEKDSPEDLQKFYEGLDGLAEDLLESAPSEIRDDVATFIDGVSSMEEPLEEVDFDITRLDMDRVPALNDPAFPSAGNRVTKYNEQVCEGGGSATEPEGDEGGTAPEGEAGPDESDTGAGNPEDGDGSGASPSGGAPDTSEGQFD